MRKLAALMGLALAAPSVAFIAASGTAHADCPGGGGTIPGTPARVITAGPIYIDDRDWTDTDDDDGEAGGLWIYLESNGKAGLQRGGDQVVFVTAANNGVNPAVPTINPIPTPVGITFFPNGFGGGSLSEATGFNDDCVQSSNPDTILL